MKNILLIALFTGILFSLIYAGKNYASKTANPGKKITSSEMYFPLSVGNELYFKAYKKDKPGEIIRLKVTVRGIEKIEGEEFFYIYAPKLDIRYLVKRNETGLYMHMLKYPFLFFGNIKVFIRPPINFFKFPSKVGLKWEEESRAEASFLFITIKRKIKGKFEITEKMTISTDIGDIEAYLVHTSINQGRDEKDILPEKFWYAKGIGYSRADTATHFAEIAGYRIRDEETGEWNEKLPENADEYL